MSKLSLSVFQEAVFLLSCRLFQNHKPATEAYRQKLRAMINKNPSSALLSALELCRDVADDSLMASMLRDIVEQIFQGIALKNDREQEIQALNIIVQAYSIIKPQTQDTLREAAQQYFLHPDISDQGFYQNCAVPVPASAALLGLGGLVAARRSRDLG